MDVELIKLFSCALEEQPLLSPALVNEEAMKRGYLVHPKVCNQSVLDFIKQQTINVNATFYRRWQDVTEKSRLELFVDQLLHYFTTYGTNYALGNGYVPNDATDVVPFSEYKTILPISQDELADRCKHILYSGAALKQTTMQACADFVISQHVPVEVDGIRNREAQTYLCDKLGVMPTEKSALLRYIIFKTTGSTLLIKNRQLCSAIMQSEKQVDFTKLNDRQFSELASVFLRFKPLFLAFKHHQSFNRKTRQYETTLSANAPVINRLRKLARKLHKPMPPQFWTSVTTLQPALSDLSQRLPQITLFKVVSLMQMCKLRMLEISEDALDRLFVVRNKKLFLRHYASHPQRAQLAYLADLYDMLEQHLVSSLSKKACATRFPENYKLAMPSTEKTFVGNMPFGTSFLLEEHNYIGIYWRDEWGTRDFDLSIVDQTGRKYGWNADYYRKTENGGFDVVFSGDMTSANPEASEVFYFAKGCPYGMIYVNRYNGVQGSKYKLYIGQEHIANLTRNYMVSPDTVKLTVDLESATDRQQPVGLIFDSKLTLMEFTMGNGRVSFANPELFESMRRRTNCFIDLETILRKAGFHEPQTIGDSQTASLEPVQLDLVNLDRATLLSLMS